MDEIELIRALRTDEEYPEAARQSARAALLDQASGRPARPAGRARGRATRTAWRAGAGFMAAGLAAAIGVAYTVSAAPSGSRPAAAPLTAARVLLLAAQHARATDPVPPPGAKWLVREERQDSTAWPAPTCDMRALDPAQDNAETLALRGDSPCVTQPPASIPRLATAKSTPIDSGDIGPLPDQPGPLLVAVYRIVRAIPADHLPGKPPGKVLAADTNETVFDELWQMVDSGRKSPSRSVALAAMAGIPGAVATKGTHDVLGRPAVEITVAGSQDHLSVFFDAATYAVLGFSSTDVPVPGGGPVTGGMSNIWSAYYDAQGNKL
jgi:hypothetical protein